MSIYPQRQANLARSSNGLYAQQYQGRPSMNNKPSSSTRTGTAARSGSYAAGSAQHYSSKAPTRPGYTTSSNTYGSSASSYTNYGERASEQRRSHLGHSVGAGSYPSRTPAMTSSKAQDLGRSSYNQQPFARYKQVVKRSILADEFAIRNPQAKSCFLNVALQALWVFPAVRMNMNAFCDQREGGPPELKPLINAIQDINVKD